MKNACNGPSCNSPGRKTTGSSKKPCGWRKGKTSSGRIRPGVLSGMERAPGLQISARFGGLQRIAPTPLNREQKRIPELRQQNGGENQEAAGDHPESEDLSEKKCARQRAEKGFEAQKNGRMRR